MSRVCIYTVESIQDEEAFIFWNILLKYTQFNALFPFLFSQAQEACGPLEIDNALSMVRGLEKDMQEAKASAEAGKLKPLPGETVRRRRTLSSSKNKAFLGKNFEVTYVCVRLSVIQLEKCTQDLGNSTKAVSSAIAQLLSEATQGNENYTGELKTKTVYRCSC